MKFAYRLGQGTTGMRLMRPKDIRAARRRSKGEIVEKSRKKELKKLAARQQRDVFEKACR